MEEELSWNCPGEACQIKKTHLFDKVEMNTYT